MVLTVVFAEENLPQAGVDSKQIIFCIPWGHNKLIIDKCSLTKFQFFVIELVFEGRCK